MTQILVPQICLHFPWEVCENVKKHLTTIKKVKTSSPGPDLPQNLVGSFLVPSFHQVLLTSVQQFLHNPADKQTNQML